MPIRPLNIPGYAERVIATVTPADQERRWSAVRAAMAEAGIDVLVFHTSVDNLGGYVRWMSDLVTQGGYPISLIFPIDRPLTAIIHGANGDDRRTEPDNPVAKGIERTIATASFSSAYYTRTLDAETIAGVLKPLAPGRIGLVGLSQMPFPMVSYLHDEFGAERFVDAGPIIDPIKAVKSEEEIEAIRRTAQMQDEVFQVLLETAAPGVREIDLMAELTGRFVDYGSTAGVMMIGSSDGDHPAHIAPRRMQNRVLRQGDHILVLLERNGLEGQFTEIGRTLTLGPAPEEMHREWEFVLAAQDYCVSKLRPGITGSELLRDYNEFLRENGRPEERRLHCHGQGYDIVERPFALPGEEMPIAANMNFALHPTYGQGNYGYKVCDNYLTTEGEAVRLHTTPREIFEL